VNSKTYKTPGAASAGGVRDAFKVSAWVIFASMMGFGSLARVSGLTLGVSMVSSGAIWGLPGQIAFAELYATGAPVLAIVLAVSLANVRFLPMIVAMMPLFGEGVKNRAWHYVLAQLASVNTWAAAMRVCPHLPHELRAPYYVGFSIVCLLSGLAGTATGFVLAVELPPVVTLSLVFLNPVYFTIVFADVRHRSGVIALLIGAVGGPLFYQVSTDWGLLATGGIGGALAYFVDRILRRRHG
jgi:predicted branched-subunit amino acid permease